MTWDPINRHFIAVCLFLLKNSNISLTNLAAIMMAHLTLYLLQMHLTSSLPSSLKREYHIYSATNSHRFFYKMLPIVTFNFSLIISHFGLKYFFIYFLTSMKKIYSHHKGTWMHQSFISLHLISYPGRLIYF